MAVEKGSIEEKRLRVERTVHYFRKSGEGTDWLLLHGYGETAVDFLGRCAVLQHGRGGDLIAPEGISRFYSRGGRGSIGASWMTSLMREEEIDEYLSMITTVLHDCNVEPDARINILGFSQGGATAMRVALRGEHRVDRLVLWGAGFEERELREWEGSLREIREVLLVAGEADRIVLPEVIDRTAEVISELGGRARILTHPRGHELDASLLAEIAAMSSAR